MLWIKSLAIGIKKSKSAILRFCSFAFLHRANKLLDDLLVTVVHHVKHAQPAPDLIFNTR